MEIRKNASLVLQDGTIYKGRSFGSPDYTEGEVVFNTGLTGYQEILTDPSYAGQLVAMTFPQIGNYGSIIEDNESKKIQVRGFIVKENCIFPCNYRSSGSLHEYLKKNNIAAIEGIDTRDLTKKLRSSGTMLGFITTLEMPEKKLLDKIKNISDISKIDLVRQVTTENEYILDNSGLNIAVIDYGMKNNIAKSFHALGHKVTVLPALADAQNMLSRKFDLVLLSNGPGDPKIASYAVKTAKELAGKVPLAGICLGHQILGLSLGGDTYKLKFGHRGGNHPVKNLITDKVWITTQNHGYAVDKNTLPSNVEITHINLNDNTVEGLRCNDKKIYCVQFHPEASPGPEDCHHIFNDFINELCK